MDAKIKGSQGAHVLIAVEGEQERAIAASRGANLLDSLREAGIYLPSQCGGVGSCGQCRVEILGAAPEPTPAERAWLTERERARGVRLSCQHRARGDVRLSLPRSLRGGRLVRARLCARRFAETDLALLSFANVEPPQLDFRSGQYLELLIPPARGDANRPQANPTALRAYSIASSPNVPDRFELLVRRVEHGEGSAYLLDRLVEGAEARFAGPFGDFTLADGEDPVLLLAAGTGIAPVRSITFDLIERTPGRPASLIYLCRDGDSIAQELETRSREHPDFAVQRTGAPDLPAAIQRELGLLRDLLRDRPGRIGHPDCFVCGAPPFVDRCVRTLLQSGVPRGQIKFDRFG